MCKHSILIIAAFLAALTTSSTASRTNEQAISMTLAADSKTYTCEWAGHEGVGVQLRFGLEAESEKSCTFVCQTIEKYSRFQERFENAFSENFNVGSSRCECIVNGGLQHLFSFKSHKALCKPGKCWDVYVKHADLGASSSTRVGALDNYAGKCTPCEDSECSKPSSFKRIALSAEEKRMIFNAAASGDIEAQRVKQVIEEFDVEPGEIEAQLVTEVIEGFDVEPSVPKGGHMPASRIHDNADPEQDPMEFVSEVAPISMPEHEVKCTALIMTSVEKLMMRLMAFMSPECGEIQYQELIEQHHIEGLEVTLPSAAGEYICSVPCREHPALVAPPDADVPLECNSSVHMSMFRSIEAVHNALMVVWNTCGNVAEEDTTLSMSSAREIKVIDVVDKFDDLVPRRIVEEDAGCTPSVRQTSPANGQIGDTCTVLSFQAHRLFANKWVRTTSTCGKVTALSTRLFHPGGWNEGLFDALNTSTVHSTDYATPIAEQVALRCYKADGTSGEMPKPGEQGICAIPKRSACGNLPCPCRPGTRCVAFLKCIGALGTQQFSVSQHFKCARLA